MSVAIDHSLSPGDLLPAIAKAFALSARKIRALEKRWDATRGTPVFTRAGKFTLRGWTEWTRGFQYGSALLQFDATDDAEFLDLGRDRTVRLMAPHLTHTGVHDHGFNNSSTYGNLWRLMREGRIPQNDREQELYELALKVSGAVQAMRWTDLPEGQGYIYSFNGPHSLFVDTLRTLRILAVAHQLGHVLLGERDRRISLLERLLQHGSTTAAYNIYYGEQRDIYDVRGRTAHESIFNCNDGSYRCPSSQQGYSPFTTWTRGLAWAILGFAEQLEFLAGRTGATMSLAGGGDRVASAVKTFRRAAQATAEYYLEQACSDGIPVWDTGAPNLCQCPGFQDQPSDPNNRWEPVDSSAAAIAAQGFLRLGRCLRGAAAQKFFQAGLTITRTLLQAPYLSEDPRHEGLLLHSVYHRPNGWDHLRKGAHVPNGESSLWGDYHLRELAVLVKRLATGATYPTFFAEQIS